MVNDASAAQTTVELGPGKWHIATSLRIQTPVTLRGVGPESVLILDTDEHYLPAIVVSGANVTVESLQVRHRSPSVANNYAVYLNNASNVALRDLDVSSATGTGVAIEGGTGTVDIIDCRLHDNRNNGLGIFPDATATDDDENARLEIRVSGTEISGNGKEAILAKGLGPGVTVRVQNRQDMIRGGIAVSNCEDADMRIVTE
jgi:hypothetical protein